MLSGAKILTPQSTLGAADVARSADSEPAPNSGP